MGQIVRQARAAGLKTQFMGPEGVGNASLSNIAGAASEGMLVTLPKRYDQVPTNKPIVDALKAKNSIQPVPLSGPPTLRCNQWRPVWNVAKVKNRKISLRT